MKCIHCGRELVFYPRTDRASGIQAEVYRCITAALKCENTGQRSRSDVDKDILTVLVNVPQYDELPYLWNDHGMAQRLDPA